MIFGKQPHILNASTNLLGICFIVITGLKLSGSADKTWADEISAVAACALLASSMLSYISMRTEKHAARYEVCADYSFIGGLFMLFVAVLAFARDFF